MYAVAVIGKELREAEAFGPYRTLAKAREVAALLRNPQAVDYRDEEDYDVCPVRLQAYGE